MLIHISEVYIAYCDKKRKETSENTQKKVDFYCITILEKLGFNIGNILLVLEVLPSQVGIHFPFPRSREL